MDILIAFCAGFALAAFLTWALSRIPDKSTR